MAYNFFVISSCYSFEVNFRNSKDEDAEIPLHLSVRFDQDIIVRNTRINGAWGHEEREDNLHPFTTPNPIVPGTKTNICIGIRK